MRGTEKTSVIMQIAMRSEKKVIGTNNNCKKKGMKEKIITPLIKESATKGKSLSLILNIWRSPLPHKYCVNNKKRSPKMFTT